MATIKVDFDRGQQLWRRLDEAVTAPATPSSASATSRRMPGRDEVRSLIFPKNGLPNIANGEPILATSAKLFGACSIPKSELTFSAKVTSSGEEHQGGAHVRRRVQRHEPHPTRCRPRPRQIR